MKIINKTAFGFGLVALFLALIGCIASAVHGDIGWFLLFLVILIVDVVVCLLYIDNENEEEKK